jgi:hypothetical protein
MTETKYTPEQVAAWKKQYGEKNIHLLTTDDGREAVVRTPMLSDLEKAMDANKKPKAKSLDFNRVLFRSCVLWHSADLMEDEARQLEVLTAIGGISDIKEATIKKL